MALATLRKFNTSENVRATTWARATQPRCWLRAAMAACGLAITLLPAIRQAGADWVPPPGTTWQWQITGVIDESFDVEMYDIDLFDAAPAGIEIGEGTGVFTAAGPNAGVIDRLHRRGIIVICYVDTGAWENYRPDANLFPVSVKGNPTGWKGERWLDIRDAAWPLWAPLMWARFDLAVQIGCDGVEPDQNNPVGNNPGFPITLADQKRWYLEVAAQAHARGLSVGQKNGIETTDADTIAAFDWNLNEQCFQFKECDLLDPVIAAGKAVFQTEYKRPPKRFCPAANEHRFSSLRKTKQLGAWQRPCWIPGYPVHPAPG